MNDSSQTTPPAPADGLPTLVLLFLGVLVCGITLNTQSFWIDEAGTAYRSSLPTLGEWWHRLSVVDSKDADNQLPLYMVFAWAWEKLSGLTEWAFRAGNVPWFLAGFLVLVRAVAPDRRLRWILPLLVLLSPFVWYYLGEARTYAMQVGLSLVVFGALYRLGSCAGDPARERPWVVILCGGAWLLSASGMLAMLWAGAYLGAALLSTRRDRLLQLARAHHVWWGLMSLLLLATGLYYLWTLRGGTRATALATTNLKTILFLPYELFGFSGLGPGRSVLRAGTLDVLKPWLPLLGIHAGLLLLFLAAGWKKITATISRRTLACWTLTFALVLGFLLAVGVTSQFRVLGRHCTPALPVLLFVLAAGITAVVERQSRLLVIAGVAFLGLNLASGLSLRFGERHARDDYRSAANLGRTALADGETVWWNASQYGAWIYHLPAEEPVSAPHSAAVFIMNPETGFDQTLPRPTLVITSKPDVYDGHGTLAEYLKREGFRPVTNYSSFMAWRIPSH